MSKTLTELVREQVHLDSVVDGTLWYKTDSGFPFSVPLSDTRGATFRLHDKGIMFMRWIRPALQEFKDRGDDE